MPEPALVQLPGVKTFWLLARNTFAFESGHRGLDRGHHRAGNLILNGEYVHDLSIEALSPHVVAGLGIDKLRIDA